MRVHCVCMGLMWRMWQCTGSTPHEWWHCVFSPGPGTQSASGVHLHLSGLCTCGGSCRRNANTATPPCSFRCPLLALRGLVPLGLVSQVQLPLALSNVCAHLLHSTVTWRVVDIDKLHR